MADVQSATITCRIEKLSDPSIVGLSVSEVRANFGEILNIPSSATPTIRGYGDVDEDYVVGEGETLNFTLALGEKGI